METEFLSCGRIVDKINSSIGQDPNAASLIGVLDIYGFESFKINRYTTATINQSLTISFYILTGRSKIMLFLLVSSSYVST